MADDLEIVTLSTDVAANTRNNMSDVEVRALFACRYELRHGINPVLVATKLHEYQIISTPVYFDVVTKFQQDIDRVDICEHLISHIPANTNIPDLVKVLDECGYRKLASKLFLTFLKLNTSGISHVQNSTAGQRSTVHAFFRRLKRMVHDAQFENPRLALRNLANKFVEKMNDELDPVRRQLLADKCVAIIGAEIDAIAITFDNRLCKHDVFAQMKGLVPETSNTLITDVVYYGRLANANSIAGNFKDSDDMLVAARCRAYNTGPCLELVNMLYIEVYVRLWQYEKFPNRELRESLMMWGRIGLESLEEEDVDTKTLWRRMFILRMVFCLLGLGNRANVIDGCQVDEACIQEASSLLADIDSNWYGIETRREMFYYVARARLNEFTNNISDCVRYSTKAIKCAREGHFEEIEFITQYRDVILLKIYANNHVLDQSDASRTSIESRNFVIGGSLSDSSQMDSYVARWDFGNMLTPQTAGIQPNGDEHATVQTSETGAKVNDNVHGNITDPCPRFNELDMSTGIPTRNFVLQHSELSSSYLDEHSSIGGQQFKGSQNQQALSYIPVSNRRQEPEPLSGMLGRCCIQHESKTVVKETNGGRKETPDNAEPLHSFHSLDNEYKMMHLKNQEVIPHTRQPNSNEYNYETTIDLQAMCYSQNRDETNTSIPFHDLNIFVEATDQRNSTESEDENTHLKHLGENEQIANTENNVPDISSETNYKQLSNQRLNNESTQQHDTFYDERGEPSGCSHE